MEKLDINKMSNSDILNKLINGDFGDEKVFKSQERLTLENELERRFKIDDARGITYPPFNEDYLNELKKLHDKIIEQLTNEKRQIYVSEILNDKLSRVRMIRQEPSPELMKPISDLSFVFELFSKGKTYAEVARALELRNPDWDKKEVCKTIYIACCYHDYGQVYWTEEGKKFLKEDKYAQWHKLVIECVENGYHFLLEALVRSFRTLSLNEADSFQRARFYLTLDEDTLLSGWQSVNAVGFIFNLHEKGKEFKDYWNSLGGARCITEESDERKATA